MSTPSLRIVNKNINLRKGAVIAWQIVASEEPDAAKSQFGGFLTLAEDGRVSFALSVREGDLVKQWGGDLYLVSPGYQERHPPFRVNIPITAGAFEDTQPDIVLIEGANSFQ